jgi:anaerobic selenocysteine-containing dehydrogenase
MDTKQATTRVSTFCPLCVSRCGARAVVTDGAFVALEPDPSHPTGAALCVKGRAAPEIVRHPERLLHPLRRTNPKGATDPGWQQISWDEALDTIAARLLRLAGDHGPESVVFGTTSPSTSAMSDAVDWLNRLRRKSAPDPQVELHPGTAAARGIAAGDWVRIQTPHGDVRARFNASLDPKVVCGQHGWWQACAELGLPGYPPFGPGSANLNLVLRQRRWR